MIPVEGSRYWQSQQEQQHQSGTQLESVPVQDRIRRTQEILGRSSVVGSETEPLAAAYGGNWPPRHWLRPDGSDIDIT